MLRLENTAALDPRKLTAKDRALWERFPADFRRFYQKQNGGRCERELTVAMTWAMGSKTRKKQTTTLDELWRFDRRRLAKGPASILVEHFGRHVDEGFLPPDVFVFGRTIQNSLVAISIAKHDFGNVYYWEWYWQYPWYQGFFLARVKESVRRFKSARKDLEGRTFGAEHTEGDAANYGTLVKVAESFSAFVRDLRTPRD